MTFSWIHQYLPICHFGNFKREEKNSKNVEKKETRLPAIGQREYVYLILRRYLSVYLAKFFFSGNLSEIAAGFFVRVVEFQLKMNWHSFCDEYKRGYAFLSLGLSFSVSFSLYLCLTCFCIWKKTGKFRERTQFNVANANNNNKNVIRKENRVARYSQTTFVVNAFESHCKC